VINLDVHAPGHHRLKASHELGQRCRCRPLPYLNNLPEQDHRFVRKGVAASLWLRSVDGKIRTIAGIRGHEDDPQRPSEVVGQGKIIGKVQSIEQLFGVDALPTTPFPSSLHQRLLATDLTTAPCGGGNVPEPKTITLRVQR
jgi:hypothetical protein